ncbi:hypothetical protein EMCG_02846 [[Emmonsia] crescens]|uniref:Uncharacterized protein n=1 Tax=[Emmonsia] crescens TaxID=73230 RepID=A0A0G2HXG4_9EURO|nr:hypothetical protein EMCG_02846 [Emmonsia crescens UAMH 3008]
MHSLRSSEKKRDKKVNEKERGCLQNALKTERSDQHLKKMKSRRRELATGEADDFYRDIFLHSVRDYQKAFIKANMDEFYATGQEPIPNIDIEDLMKQIV